MSLLLGIMLWLLLAVLGLVGLFVITPAFFRVHLTNSPQFAYRVEVHAIGGLAPRFTLAQGPRKNSVALHKKKLKKPKQRRSSRPKRVNGALLRALPDLVTDMLHHVHLKRMHIDADYGLGDPADTGQLSGLLMSLQYASPLPASVSLNLRPVFTSACLKGSMTTDVRVTLATFLIPVLRFAARAFGPVR